MTPRPMASATVISTSPKPRASARGAAPRSWRRREQQARLVHDGLAPRRIVPGEPHAIFVCRHGAGGGQEADLQRRGVVQRQRQLGERTPAPVVHVLLRAGGGSAGGAVAAEVCGLAA